MLFRSKCDNEERYLYKSKCKSKKWLCEECLINIHDVKEFPHDKYVPDFKQLFYKKYDKHKLSYSSINDFTKLQNVKSKLETDNKLLKNAIENNMRAPYKEKYYDYTVNYNKYFNL